MPRFPKNQLHISENVAGAARMLSPAVSALLVKDVLKEEKHLLR
jgi:hypothetical protein